jgi:hypothetical protein
LIALYQDILLKERPDRIHPATNREELLGRLQGLTGARNPGGDPDAAALPQRIVAALQDGSDRVDLGDGHTLVVTPGLALDAGFVSAYWAGQAARPAVITDHSKFKAMTEACVSQHALAKLCFSVGYAHGAAAFAAARGQ